MVKVLLTALAFVAPFTPLQQVHDDFTTFETASYFNDAFSDLEGYQLGIANNVSETQILRFEVDYDGDPFIYYVFPIFYDLETFEQGLIFYYSNDSFNFYITGYEGEEQLFDFNVLNYTGGQLTLSFGRLDVDAMTTYINNEKGKDVVSDIIGTITSMVTGLLSGIGTGVVGMFNSLFLDGSNISSLGIWIIVLLGLSIALGAVAWVSTLIRGKQR